MSARIGAEVFPGGEIVSTYVHRYGDPSAAGAILEQHYRTQVKVGRLLNLGDLSFLGKEIGRKHAFEGAGKAHPDWCLAYARDRGDDPIVGQAIVSPSAQSFLSLTLRSDSEFAYLFAVAPDRLRVWMVAERRHGRTWSSWMPLSEVIARRAR